MTGLLVVPLKVDFLTAYVCTYNIYASGSEAQQCRGTWRRMELTQAKLPTWTITIGVPL